MCYLISVHTIVVLIGLKKKKTDLDHTSLTSLHTCTVNMALKERVALSHYLFFPPGTALQNVHPLVLMSTPAETQQTYPDTFYLFISVFAEDD